MTTTSTAQAVTELTERLQMLTRSQLRLTSALRDLRTGQSDPASSSTASSSTVSTPVGLPNQAVRSASSTSPSAPPASPPRMPAHTMLRVTPLQRPHRATKRNYDYFQRLQDQLANLPRPGDVPPTH